MYIFELTNESFKLIMPKIVGKKQIVPFHTLFGIN